MSERVLLLLPTEWEARIVSELSRSRSMRVVRRCADLADLLAAAAAGLGTLALVSTAVRGMDRSALASLDSSGLAVVGVVSGKDEVEESRLRQLGLMQVVPFDATVQQLTVATGAARAEGSVQREEPTTARPGDVRSPVTVPLTGLDGDWSEPQARAPAGRVVAVWGPTGAPGRSTLAVNLAAELGRAGARVLLVDADPYGGTVAPALGLLDEASGLLAAIRHAEAGTLDVPTLARCAAGLTPRWRVLTGIASGHRWPELRPAGLERVLAVARRWVSHVVVDCGFCLEDDEDLSYDTAAPRRNGATLCALSTADDVVVVGAADPIGLQRLVRGLADLSEAFPSQRRHIVVNRVRASAVGPKPELRVLGALSRFAGLDSATLVPEDREAFDAAMLRGVSLGEVAPGAAARRCFADLASGFNPRAGQPPRRSWRVGRGVGVGTGPAG